MQSVHDHAADLSNDRGAHFIRPHRRDEDGSVGVSWSTPLTRHAEAVDVHLLTGLSTTSDEARAHNCGSDVGVQRFPHTGNCRGVARNRGRSQPAGR